MLCSIHACHFDLLRHRDPDALSGTRAQALSCGASGSRRKIDFDGNQTVGNIASKNALDLIRQWAVLNREALESNWSKIKTGQPLDRIPPLD